MLATTEIQQYLFQTLSADPTLQGLVGNRIYDQVPDDAAFPYVKIGEVSTAPFNNHSRDGEVLVMTIGVWSRADGFKEGKTIAEAIRPLIHGIAFTTSNFSGFATEFPSFWLHDPDGITRQGVLDFRFFAHKV